MYFTLISTSASVQNIHIQAFPQTVNYRENDLVIVCSITNPTQLTSVFFIQLLKNSSTTFETIVSVANGQTPPVQWKDTALQSRASATGSINSPTTAQLRLSIHKNSVQCPNDFKMYMCKFAGYNSYSEKIVTQETNPITISYIGKSCKLKYFNVYFSDWKLFCKEMLAIVCKCNKKHSGHIAYLSNIDHNSNQILF